mmetsp:Transcript_10019/g.27285  ORF Transcript_10019/g.27285 Transcript_10019/m.27285 type:complete len:235 (-) Transcript_10019:676-1380(-)
MFARILLKQIKETVESSSTDDPKCCLQPYMGKCLDTDEALRIGWNYYLRMHEPLYRFHLSPCAALAVEAFRSLQQFLSNAAALYLIHSSCEDELKRCKRTLRSTLKKLQARNAPGNSSGSSGCSNQETLAVDIIDLTTDDNEGQDRKRRRQDPDDDDDEEEEEEEDGEGRGSRKNGSGFGRLCGGFSHSGEGGGLCNTRHAVRSEKIDKWLVSLFSCVRVPVEPGETCCFCRCC